MPRRCARVRSMKSTRKLSSAFCSQSGRPSQKPPHDFAGALKPFWMRREQKGISPETRRTRRAGAAIWTSFWRSARNSRAAIMRRWPMTMFRPLWQACASARRRRRWPWNSAILTAARSGEILEAQWPEIDFEKRLWTVPAERMKAAREHRVPLSSRALAILEKLSEARNRPFCLSGPTRRASRFRVWRWRCFCGG